MNKALTAVLLATVLLTAGCFSIPTFFKSSKKVDKAQDKIAKTEEKIQENKTELQEKARDLTYASNYSLSLDPNPSIYSLVAQELTDKSLVASGLPDMKEVETLRLMVQKLVSTNQAIREQGEKLLAKKDKEIISLQKERDSLSEKLDKQTVKLNDVATEAGIKAAKWETLTNIFKYALWAVLIGVIVHLLSFIIPPPYNIPFTVVSMIFGVIGRGVFKVAPQAASFAGAVSQSTYQKTHETLKDVVASIQDLKEKRPESFVQGLEEFLKYHTTEETRQQIDEIKKVIKTP